MKQNRTAGGGVAIAFNQDKMRLVERKISAGRAEIVCASGKLPGAARKVVIFGVYIPPRTRAPQVNTIMNLLNDEISKAKTELCDPVIIIGGDYNKKPYNDSIDDFPDISLLQTGPTRGDEVLDMVMTNIPSSATTRDPLESNDGTLTSDHAVVYVEAKVGTKHRFKWKTVRTRAKNAKNDLAFESMISNYDWNKVTTKPNASLKAAALADALDLMMNTAYPKETKRIRNTDDPWTTHVIRKRIRSRKRTFGREFRSDKWKYKKADTNRMIRESKRDFYTKFTEIAKKTGDSSIYYKMVTRLKTGEPRRTTVSPPSTRTRRMQQSRRKWPTFFAPSLTSSNH